MSAVYIFFLFNVFLFFFFFFVCEASSFLKAATKEEVKGFDC